MFPIINIGPAAVQAPGLILLLSVWLGLTLAEREAKKQGDASEALSGLVFTGLAAGLIGARLWYAARHLDTYLADPLGLFSLGTSTFDLTGGLIIGGAAAWLYGRRRHIPLRLTLDRLTPGLALFAVGLGLAHLASGDAFGAPTDLPWGIELWDARRHPSQIYQMIVAGLIFFLVWRRHRHAPFPGFLFLGFVILTAAARLILEPFRGDSVIVAGSLRQPMLTALLVMLAAMWLLGRWARES